MVFSPKRLVFCALEHQVVINIRLRNVGNTSCRQDVSSNKDGGNNRDSSHSRDPLDVYSSKNTTSAGTPETTETMTPSGA